MKTCYICKESKPESDYHKDKTRVGGFSNRCKACEATYYREKRSRNRDSYKDKDKRYYLKNKSDIVIKRKEHYLLNRKKYLAHEKVKNALYKGLLDRKSCEVCSNTISEAHHDDYNKPLEVRWLCKSCHMHWHRHNSPIL